MNPIVIWKPNGYLEPQDVEVVRSYFRRSREEVFSGWNGSDVLPDGALAVTAVRPPYAQTCLAFDWIYLAFPEGEITGA